MAGFIVQKHFSQCKHGLIAKLRAPGMFSEKGDCRSSAKSKGEVNASCILFPLSVDDQGTVHRSNPSLSLSTFKIPPEEP